MLFFKRVLLNYKVIFKYATAAISFVALVIGAIFSWPECIEHNYLLRAAIVFGIGAIIVLAVIIYVMCFYNKNTIWKRGKASISLMYGDLMQIAFEKKKPHRIVVINVNTTFDTQVDEAGSVQHPLVSPSTVHGLWLKTCEKKGLSISLIDKAIDESLKETQAKSMPWGKERGKTKDYPIGTIAMLSCPVAPVTFLLVALSRFDKNNNAQSSNADLSKCITEIVKFCNENGQGEDVYIPLMGTGQSRMKLTDEQALLQEKSLLLANSNDIQNRFFIVVYEKKKNDVSISE